MNPALQQLLQRPDVWRKRDCRSLPSVRARTTGFATLDSELVGGGWPNGALVELLPAQYGIGELSLLAPLLAELGHKQLLTVWINPPFIPYAPALAQRDIALESLLIVRGEPQHHLWACEQALRNTACGAVLYWPAKPLRYPELRKLQVAAATQNAVGFLFRDTRTAQQNSPATLRLQLTASDAQLSIHILKQRGRESGQTLLIAREKVFQPTPTIILPTLAEMPLIPMKMIAMPERKIALHTTTQPSSQSVAALQ